MSKIEIDATVEVELLDYMEDAEEYAAAKQFITDLERKFRIEGIQSTRIGIGVGAGPNWYSDDEFII